MTGTSDTFKGIPLTELTALIGRTQSMDGVDEVSRNDIRRKLEVFCFDCPLYTDDAAARAQGYRMAIAPSAMVYLWALPAYWSPGDAQLFAPGNNEKDGTQALALPRVYPNSVNAANESEFFEPVYPGDRLSSVSKLVEVQPRNTRLGDGVFLTTETVITKLSGEKVCVRRNSSFQYVRRPDAASASAASADMERQEWSLPQVVDWSRQVRFEDVMAGNEIPSYGIWLSYQRIVMSIAVDRMFSGIHHNRDFARAAGLSDIIFNTRGYETLMEITLRRWMGLAGRLHKLGPFRMTANAHPGDYLTCSCEVRKTHPADRSVEVALSVKSGRGLLASGTARVSLPSKIGTGR